MSKSEVSIYKQILEYLDGKFLKNERVTPSQLAMLMSYTGSSWDFTNAFNALCTNGVLDLVPTSTPSFNNMTIEYVYKKPSSLKVDVVTITRSEILTKLSNVGNEISQIYALVEQLQRPEAFDITKVSKDDLIAELSRRFS